MLDPLVGGGRGLQAVHDRLELRADLDDPKVPADAEPLELGFERAATQHALVATDDHVNAEQLVVQTPERPAYRQQRTRVDDQPGHARSIDTTARAGQ